MANLRYYLDTRGKNNNNTFPIRLAINHRSQTAYISLPIKISPDQWDANSEKVVKHSSAKQMNNILLSQKAFYLQKFMDLSIKLNIYKYSAAELKNMLLDRHDKESLSFFDLYEKFKKTIKSENTLSTYENAKKKLEDFCDIKKIKPFEIDDNFLERFDQFLISKNQSQNSRFLLIAKIKSTLHYADRKKICEINNSISNYNLKIEKTRKRNLTCETLRKIFSIKTDNQHMDDALRIFKVVFGLIGINFCDLFSPKLKVIEGRVEFQRGKTGKFYSIKMPNEIAKDFVYVRNLNRESKLINSNINRQLKKATGMNISLYWARHSWATIAAELDIPKETIANALGHSQNSVTDIYIEFNQKKVDDANKQVLDFIFNEK